MNEFVAYCIVSTIWGLILWACGSYIKDIFKARLWSSGIGFLVQIVGCIFIVIAAIGFSAFIITGIASTVSALI